MLVGEAGLYTFFGGQEVLAEKLLPLFIARVQGKQLVSEGKSRRYY